MNNWHRIREQYSKMPAWFVLAMLVLFPAEAVFALLLRYLLRMMVCGD